VDRGYLPTWRRSGHPPHPPALPRRRRRGCL